MNIVYNPLFDSETSEVVELQATVQRLEEEIKDLHVIRKPVKKRKELTGEAKAFATFLKLQKNNDLLIDNIKSKMKALGYNCQSKVPHQIFKLECEMLFKHLSFDDKQKYME